MLPEAPEGPPENAVEFGYGNGAVLCSRDGDEEPYDTPDPVGVMAVEPALGLGLGPVAFDMVKGGTSVGLIVPGAVFPTPLEPKGTTLELEVGNGGIGRLLAGTGTVWPAGLPPGTLLPDPRDVIRLGDDGGAVVSPKLPVGPALGEVAFDRGKGGVNPDDVFSGVGGIDAPVLNGAVPVMPPVGATVWPPGPPVLLVRGNGAVENVFASDVLVSVWAVDEPVMDTDPVPVCDPKVPVGRKDDGIVPFVMGNGAKDPDMLELRAPELTGTLVIDGLLGNPEVTAVCDPVMMFDAEAVPSTVGLPCPEGPGGGVSEPVLVVLPTIPVVDEGTDIKPVEPTVTVVLKVGNGAGAQVDPIEVTEGAVLDATVDCGEGEIDPEPAGGPVSDALLGLVNGNGGDVPDADSEVVTGMGETEPVKVPAVYSNRKVREGLAVVPLPYPPDDEPVAPAVPGELVVRKVWVVKDTDGLEVGGGGTPFETLPGWARPNRDGRRIASWVPIELLLGAGNTLPVPDIDKLDDQTEDAEV
ncbi:hypothetical protein PG996_007613 [Apiospora saccharicola]|uniref:Uncharacterized protein n=1 Tax=Apiospora saccharicola TaxID=335842 RepID=A0ABR1VBD4_9PEZI